MLNEYETQQIPVAFYRCNTFEYCGKLIHFNNSIKKVKLIFFIDSYYTQSEIFQAFDDYGLQLMKTHISVYQKVEY